MEEDTFYPDLVKKMQTEALRLQRRLEYAELQLAREAKFLPRYKPENDRFYRAYDTCSEVGTGLGDLAALRGPWSI